ncbi:MAG: T9SS type A sorting domain-containing protein [Chthoniobacterales bacterium]
MKRHLFMKFVLSAFAILGLAATSYASVPAMDVTVFDAAGKVTFKGPIDANATFETRKLRPGNYVVQFNAKSSAVKGDHYLLVVSAGKAKVIAEAVPGEKLTTGGAAMRVSVGADLRITGQVAIDRTVGLVGAVKYRVINGKRFVWVANELGSNTGGHWVEADSVAALNVSSWSEDKLRKEQDRGGEGSMLDRMATPAERPH